MTNPPKLEIIDQPNFSFDELLQHRFEITERFLPKSVARLVLAEYSLAKPEQPKAPDRSNFSPLIDKLSLGENTRQSLLHLIGQPDHPIKLLTGSQIQEIRTHSVQLFDTFRTIQPQLRETTPEELSVSLVNTDGLKLCVPKSQKEGLDIIAKQLEQNQIPSREIGRKSTLQLEERAMAELVSLTSHYNIPASLEDTLKAKTQGEQLYVPSSIRRMSLDDLAIISSKLEVACELS